MPKIVDRVAETTTTTGTGPLVLNGAKAGFRSFLAALAIGDAVYYSVAGATEWEVGVGTLGSGTIARTTILASSNGGAAVALSAGVKDVLCSPPAAELTGRLIPATFRAALQFVGQEQMVERAVTGPIEFTVDTAGAFDGASVSVDLIANGTNVPTFAAPFRQWGGSMPYSNTAGTRNCLTFFRRSGAYYYANVVMAAAEAGAPTVTTAPAIIGSSATVGFAVNYIAGEYAGAVTSLTRQWTLDGVDIAGATGATYTPVAPGALRVRETATNASGSISSTSAPATVSAPVVVVPPAGAAGEITLRTITGNVAITTCGWNASGADYDRDQKLVDWVNGVGSLTIWRTFLDGGFELPARSYPVMVAGVQVAVATFTAGLAGSALYTVVNFSTASLPDGWVRVWCEGLGSGEWSPTEYAYNRLSSAEPSLMPIWEDSHKRPGNPSIGVQASTWVPTSYNPTPVPLTAERTFGAVTAESAITGQQLTTSEPSVQFYIPNKSRRGTVSGTNKQAYYWYDSLPKYPMLPLLDGPRGVGTHPVTMHLEVGFGAPNGVPRRNWYAGSPWGVVRGRKDGSSTTLVGWRHVGMASHWEDGALSPTLQLVGDWSAVPEARRGIWALRSFAWDEASLALDEAATPIPGEPGQPHFLGAGPVLYIAEQRESCNADTITGRILRVQFSAIAHDVPPVVTEFVTGLRGPWGVQDWGSKIIVSERNASRVIAVDKATKAITVLAERNPALPGTAVIFQNGIPTLTGTLPERRAQPVLAPEDLKIQDGFLYISSYASESIIRINLSTLVRDPAYMVNVEIDRQAWAVKFAISDGTYAPRGTVFYSHWGQVKHANAFGTLPDGVTKWTSAAHAGAAPWVPLGYPFAVAVGNERFYSAASTLGITRLSKAEVGETPMNAALYFEGRAQWDSRHGDLRWGPGGFGPHGYSLPWGENAAMDYYLTRNGHTPP